MELGVMFGRYQLRYTQVAVEASSRPTLIPSATVQDSWRECTRQHTISS